MSIKDDKQTYVKIPVWTPDGTIFVLTIACDDHHVGHMVAEGYLDSDQYWPRIAELAKMRAKRIEREYAELLDQLSQERYAEGWIESVIDYMNS